MVYLFKKKKSANSSSWYLGENKRVDGTSKRVWEKYVGTANAIKKMVENPSLPEEIESLAYGLPVSLLKINKDINFVNIVDKICSKKQQGLSVGEHILVDIINRLDDPVSHNKLGDWFSKTVLRRIFPVKASYLSSQDYWNHWQYLNEEKIENIQEALLPNIIKDVDINQLFYDPTNFTTFIADEHKDNPKGMKRHEVSIAKYGKSKNGLKGLRQINLALLVTREYGIPLWHKPYDGNINDFTSFKFFIQSIRNKIELFLKECKSITLVFDKGNNSPKNIKKVDKDLHFYMLGSLAPSQYKEWLKIPLKMFDVEYKTAKGEITKGNHFRADVFSKRCDIVVTYNERTAYKQKKRTERKLNKALAYLKEAKKKLNGTKWKDHEEVLLRINTNIAQFHAKGIVKWQLKAEEEKLVLSYGKNRKELEYLRSSYGKSILFTDNDTLSAVEIIKAYHDKYIVEQKIKLLKNKHIISFTPNYCWTDESIIVHSFTCVMALLLFSLLKKRINEAGLKLSDEEIVGKLKGIRQGLVLMPRQKSVIPIIEKMDSIQKELYNELNLGKMNKG